MEDEGLEENLGRTAGENAPGDRRTQVANQAAYGAAFGPPIGTSLQYRTEKYGPFAAVVVRVNHDGSRELYVFKPSPLGKTFIASGVFPYPTGPLGHYWMMPAPHELNPRRDTEREVRGG